MRGTVFLNTEGELVWRSEEFLGENPGFINGSYEFILKAWKFDTEDQSTMLRMFEAFSELKLSQRGVLDFAKSIDFDIRSLRS